MTDQAMTTDEEVKALEKRHGFDESMAGKRAECDGGGMVMNSKYAAREDFSGTLTGQFYDAGDPPWRWYLMIDLTSKPDHYPTDAVWCESESIFLIED